MTAGSVGRVVSSFLLDGGLVVLAAVAAVVAVSYRPLARRWATTEPAAAAALASIGLVVAVTMAVRLFETEPAQLGIGLPRLACLDAGDCWDRVVEADRLWWLNVVLFVPAGVFVTRTVRRPVATSIGLIVLSLAIEAAQGATGLGAPDPGDLVANSLGAAVGTVVGVVSARIERRPAGERGSRSRRTVVASVAGAVAVAGFVWLGLVAGADARRRALETDVREAFAGTTADDIAAALRTPAGAESLFVATTTRPGYLGQVGDTDRYEARYSTEFFGFDRCVFARWSADGLTVQRGAGRECTEFRDRPPDVPDR